MPQSIGFSPAPIAARPSITTTFSFGCTWNSGGVVEIARVASWISDSDAARIRHHLATIGLPTRLQDIAGFAQEGLADADRLMALMAQDKKVKRGQLTFILLEAIGRAVIAPDVDPALVRDFMARKLANRA